MLLNPAKPEVLVSPAQPLVQVMQYMHQQVLLLTVEWQDIRPCDLQHQCETQSTAMSKPAKAQHAQQSPGTACPSWLGVPSKFHVGICYKHTAAGSLKSTLSCCYDCTQRLVAYPAVSLATGFNLHGVT